MSNFFKKLIFTLFIVFFSWILLSANNITRVSANEVEADIHIFSSKLCPHCRAAEEFLKELKKEQPRITIYQYEVSYQQNSQLLTFLANQLEVNGQGVPFILINNQAIIGFSEATTPNDIHRLLGEETVEQDLVKSIIRANQMTPIIKELGLSESRPIEASIDSLDKNNKQNEEIDLPLFGKVNYKQISLPILTIMIAFLDGFNPCAMWVLLFMISLLLPNNDRKRIFILGGIFIFTSALFYFMLMMAWVNTIVLVAANLAFRIIVGVFALAAGGYNLYQFIKNLRQKDVGCEVTDEKQRTKLMDRVKNIINQNKLILAILGVIALALIVNFIELACSAGLPIVFANILALNGLGGWSSLGYVLIYIFFFILDDLVVFAIVMLTLKIKVVSNKIARYNHLIGGLIMLIIGILMIFLPNVLQFNF